MSLAEFFKIQNERLEGQAWFLEKNFTRDLLRKTKFRKITDIIGQTNSLKMKLTTEFDVSEILKLKYSLKNYTN